MSCSIAYMAFPSLAAGAAILRGCSGAGVDVFSSLDRLRRRPQHPSTKEYTLDDIEVPSMVLMS